MRTLLAFGQIVAFDMVSYSVPHFSLQLTHYFELEITLVTFEVVVLPLLVY